MKLHDSITPDAIAAMVLRDDSEGFCIACGAEAAGVEPDARRYVCECCGEAAVYGAEELLMEITPEALVAAAVLDGLRRSLGIDLASDLGAEEEPGV